MDNAEVMSRIYSELYNVISPRVGESLPSDLLCLFTIGRSVSDNYDASVLANIVPTVNKSYASSGKLVSGGYDTSLSGHFKDDQKHTPQEEINYQNSLKILYDNYGTEDEDTSVKYKKYKKAKRKYVLAVNALESAKNNPSYPRGRSDDYPSLNDLQLDVADAYDDLIMAYRDEVETALSEVNTYHSFSQSNYIKNLQEKYLVAARSSFPVTCEPDNWTNAAAWKKMAWKKVDIKFSASSSSIHTDVQKIENHFQESYRCGFWFFSSGASSENMDYSLSKDLETVTATDKLSLSLELSEVVINRDWLDTSFFTFEDVFIDGKSRGCITKGSLSAADIADCALPLIPVSLILAKDVAIYDDFNENVYQFIERAKGSSGCSSHYGPFGSGSGNVTHSDSSDYTDEERRAYPQTSKIEFPGVQIIGVKCAVTAPLFPQQDAH